MFNKSYNIAAVERANHENRNAFNKLNVILPDDSTETINISVSAFGQSLLDSVCDCIELFERDYFGLLYNENDSKTNTTVQRWLKMDKAVRKQIKDERTLQFRMRYIPADLNQMSETYTRYQLFLQIKHDLLVNRSPCPRDMAIKMAAYALQSEIGDYNSSLRPGYVGEFRFIHDQNSAFEAEVASYHESLKGLPANEAELQYLTVARSLPYYGCDQYSAVMGDKKCQFGLSAQGVIVNPFTDNIYIIPWNSIDKVLNKGKLFVLKVLLNQPLYAMSENGPDFSLHQARSIDTSTLHQKQGSTLKFGFPCKLAAKEAWSACIETHSFFRVRDPNSLPGSGTKGRSNSFFRAPSFSGRRTLLELLDVRRRNRTIDRSFSRTPSKRYSRRTNPNDKSQHIVHGRGSLISHTGGGKQRAKPPNDHNSKLNSSLNAKPNSVSSPSVKSSKNDLYDSDVDSDDDEDEDDEGDNFQYEDNKENKKAFHSITGGPGAFRPKSSVSQSVRVNKSQSPSAVITRVPATQSQFPKSSVSHTSLPRGSGTGYVNKHKDNNSGGGVNSSDKTPDLMTKSFTKEKSKVTNGPRTGNIHELKNTNNGRGPITSNPSLIQSAERMAQLDPDSVVDMEIRAQDGRYGFTIRGGLQDNSNYPVIVMKVTRGSAADKCSPRLCEGDQIIRINHKIADQYTSDQIKDIIRTTGQKKDGNGLLHLSVKQRLYFPESSDDEAINSDLPSSPPITKNHPNNYSSNAPPIPTKASSLLSSSSLHDFRTEMKLLEEGLNSKDALHQFDRLYKQKKGLTMNEAKKEENLSKNRYKDILPYDQTRVIIRNGEYINANFIKMDVGSTHYEYIAAQGPLRHTACDFMQMILENRVGLVVMLTELTERGRAKCYQYWPGVGESIRLSPVSGATSAAASAGRDMNSANSLMVWCDSESIQDNIAVRELRICKANVSLSGSENNVTHKFQHIQYLNWPDHDVPKEMSECFVFVKKMRQIRYSSLSSAPVLVHCSAGIGRTGVVITMDLGMSYIDLKAPFDVLSLVRDIRSQRAMLIQSQKQYEFVCRSILSYYKNHTRL